MPEILVVQASKYGNSEKYAKWIAEHLGADLINVSEVKATSIAGYNKIIFGGGLYASKINGFSFIKNNINDFKGKKLFVFAVGSAPYTASRVEELRKANFTPEAYSIPLFYFQGGYDHSKVKGVDRMIMNVLIWGLKRNPEKNSAMLDVLVNGKCGCKIENILPLVEAVKKE